MASCAGADGVYVLDTGSTDGTPELLRALGTAVYEQTITPWRFDAARNASLALLPEDADVCICLDLDEVLCPGWREALEAAWAPGTTRARYTYVWSHTPDGGDGVVFFADKIHARHGYRWTHPVHEVLTPDRAESCITVPALRVEHWPDSSKSRGQYLPLLELSAAEDPDDDRALPRAGVHVPRTLGRCHGDADAAPVDAHGDLGSGAGGEHALHSPLLRCAGRLAQRGTLARARSRRGSGPA